MVRAHTAMILWFALIALAGPSAASAAAPAPDPFATPPRAGEGSSTSAAAETAPAPATAPAPTTAAPAPPSPACEYTTEATCSKQNTGLLLKSGAYVFIAVLLGSLLRVWWNRRGTNTAGVRFVATLLPTAGAAGALAYFDPVRGQDLACCLASPVYQGQILMADSALARAALLGFVPAAIAFVLVAIVLRIVRG